MEKEKRINIIIEFRFNKRIMYLKRISVWPIPRKEYLCHSPLKNPLVSFISFCFLAKCFAIFRAGIKKRVFVPRSRGAKAAARATLAFLCHVHLACTCPPPTIHRQPPTTHQLQPRPLPNEQQHSNACQFSAFSCDEDFKPPPASPTYLCTFAHTLPELKRVLFFWFHIVLTTPQKNAHGKRKCAKNYSFLWASTIL